MHPDAARKTIRRAAAADHLREALRADLRVRRARRAAAKAVKAAKAPNRSGVPDAAKKKVLRAVPGAALREATTTSKRSLSPFLTGLPSEARFISGKPRSDAHFRLRRDSGSAADFG
jgi:hypothetical protein